MSDFYLTLLSNASMNINPDNKTSNFRVHLPRTITLDGRWKMAITELHYQNNFLNITKGNNSFEFNLCDTYHQFELSSGYYGKINDILDEINLVTSSERQDGDMLIFDTETKRTQFTREARQYVKSIRFENRLALQLGYVPNDDIYPSHLKIPQPSDVLRGVPDEILVYCDIAEPQIVGDELARVIRIVSIPKKDTFFGQTVQHEFHRLQYIEVARKQFDAISIELRDKTGEFLAFESGTVTIVLHFEKIV
jgi:hypothetical protein